MFFSIESWKREKKKINNWVWILSIIIGTKIQFVRWINEYTEQMTQFNWKYMNHSCKTTMKFDGRKIYAECGRWKSIQNIYKNRFINNSFLFCSRLTDAKFSNAWIDCIVENCFLIIRNLVDKFFQFLSIHSILLFIITRWTNIICLQLSKFLAFSSLFCFCSQLDQHQKRKH